MNIKNFRTLLIIDLYDVNSGESVFVYRNLDRGSGWCGFEGGEYDDLIRTYTHTANDLLDKYTLGDFTRLLSRCRQNGIGWESRDTLAEIQMDEYLNQIPEDASEAFALSIMVSAKLIG